MQLLRKLECIPLGILLLTVCLTLRSEQDCDVSALAGTTSEQPVYDVVIIGAGPSGISTLIELHALGIKNVLLLEKGKSHNQTVVNSYAPGKPVETSYRGNSAECKGSVCLKDMSREQYLDWMDEVVRPYASNIRYQTSIGTVKKDGELFKVQTGGDEEVVAKYVVVAVGRMGRPNKPSYYKTFPPSIRKRIHYNPKKLTDVAGQEILVVGGGDSALEYAIHLQKLGAKVTISYRKSEFSRANSGNRDAVETAATDQLLTIKRNSNVESVGEANEKPLVQFVEEGETKPFDHVLYAIGGTTPVEFLEGAGLTLGDKGVPPLKNLESTQVGGLFMAGDIAIPQGKGFVIQALNDGFGIANSISGKMNSSANP